MKVLVAQHGAVTPAVTLLADSALLRTARPMYLPEFAPVIVAAPAVIARIDRLGKHIAPRFARRYWKEVTTGFRLLACEQNGQPMATTDGALNSFDGAALQGDYPVNPADDTLAWTHNGTTLCRTTLGEVAQEIDEVVVRVSQFATLKMGDLIFLVMEPRTTLNIGDRLGGTTGGEATLMTAIK